MKILFGGTPAFGLQPNGIPDFEICARKLVQETGWRIRNARRRLFAVAQGLSDAPQ